MPRRCVWFRSKIMHSIVSYLQNGYSSLPSPIAEKGDATTEFVLPTPSASSGVIEPVKAKDEALADKTNEARLRRPRKDEALPTPFPLPTPSASLPTRCGASILGSVDRSVLELRRFADTSRRRVREWKVVAAQSSKYGFSRAFMCFREVSRV